MKNKITIEILGTGNGMRPELGNTSFLVWNNTTNKAVLFDCGYTIFPAIKKLEEETGREIFASIETVFISHLHDDHAGSAGMLALFCLIKQKKPINFVGARIDKVFKLTLEGSEMAFTYIKDDRFKMIKSNHGSSIKALAVSFNGIFYSGDTAFSLLCSKEAKEADIIIHEATLRKGPYHTHFDEIAKAPEEIRKKTYLIHNSPKHLVELKEKSFEYSFAGVLNQGQIITI